MDTPTSSRLADPRDFPGAVLGHGVVLYGSVRLGAGSRIGDYAVLGLPDWEQSVAGVNTEETVIENGVWIGPHCTLFSGAHIGAGVRMDPRCVIGCDSHVGSHSHVLYGAQVHFDVTIGERCVIAGFCCDRARIHDGAMVFGNLVHKFDKPDQFYTEAQEPSPEIMERAVVGFGALVIGGIRVNSYAYVAAGAIVTKEVPSSYLVYGCNQMSPRQQSS